MSNRNPDELAKWDETKRDESKRNELISSENSYPSFLSVLSAGLGHLRLVTLYS